MEVPSLRGKSKACVSWIGKAGFDKARVRSAQETPQFVSGSHYTCHLSLITAFVNMLTQWDYITAIGLGIFVVLLAILIICCINCQGWPGYGWTHGGEYHIAIQPFNPSANWLFERLPFIPTIG